MKRILSIDGGGIRGVFPLAFLAALEDRIGDRVANYFDLMAGTSTGGIIALALGLGYSAAEALTMYGRSGSRVFSGSGHLVLRALRRFGLAGFDSRPLQATLQAAFGDRRLGESTVRLVIPATDLQTGQARVYRTPHHPDAVQDADQRAVDVAMATSAAPLYFPTYCTPGGACFIDGGVWAINPVALAVVEALGVLGWHPEDLLVLSLGCSGEPLRFTVGTRRPGLTFWIVHGITVALAAQSSGAVSMARALVGSERVVRISPAIAPGQIDIDTVGEIKTLAARGRAEADTAFSRLREMFFRTPREPFQPLSYAPAAWDGRPVAPPRAKLSAAG
jgi:hypothetical protein